MLYEEYFSVKMTYNPLSEAFHLERLLSSKTLDTNSLLLNAFGIWLVHEGFCDRPPIFSILTVTVVASLEFDVVNMSILFLTRLEGLR